MNEKNKKNPKEIVDDLKFEQILEKTILSSPEEI